MAGRSGEGKEGAEEAPAAPRVAAKSLSWSSIAKSLLAGGVAGGVCGPAPAMPAPVCSLARCGCPQPKRWQFRCRAAPLRSARALGIGRLERAVTGARGARQVTHSRRASGAAEDPDAGPGEGARVQGSCAGAAAWPPPAVHAACARAPPLAQPSGWQARLARLSADCPWPARRRA